MDRKIIGYGLVRDPHTGIYSSPPIYEVTKETAIVHEEQEPEMKNMLMTPDVMVKPVKAPKMPKAVKPVAKKKPGRPKKVASRKAK